MMTRKSISLPILRTRPSLRRGFTLTEIAIVLGIISIILGAIWVSAGQVNEKARVTEAMNEFGAITQNMTSLLQGGYGVTVQPCGVPAPAGGPGCDITGPMIAATTQVIPQWVKIGATATASNPWTSPGLYMRWMVDNPRTYRLSFYGVTAEGCLGLIMQTTNCTPGQAGCPTAVSTGGKSPVTGYTAATNTLATTGGSAVTSAQAQGLCNSNLTPPSSPNSVEFDFTQ